MTDIVERLREKIANWEYSAKYDDVHVEALRSRLADVSGERDLILIRAENAETALGQVEARLAETEFDLKNAAMALGIAVRKQKDAEEKLAEAELSRDSWKREAELNQQAADESAEYARRLAEAEAALLRITNAAEALGVRLLDPVAIPKVDELECAIRLAREVLAADSATNRENERE